MELLVDGPQPFLVNVRVYLGRGDVFVAQKLLDTTKICSVGQKIRRIRMAQSMRRHFF